MYEEVPVLFHEFAPYLSAWWRTDWGSCEGGDTNSPSQIPQYANIPYILCAISCMSVSVHWRSYNSKIEFHNIAKNHLLTFGWGLSVYSLERALSTTIAPVNVHYQLFRSGVSPTQQMLKNYQIFTIIVIRFVAFKKTCFWSPHKFITFNTCHTDSLIFISILHLLNARLREA